MLEILSSTGVEVPLARTGVDRTAKVEEILKEAQHRLMGGGYDHMSVAAIARQLGLAQNSIYWYFPSKDDLFVAVLRRMLTKLAAKKPPGRRGLVAQLLWATDEMHDLAPLRTALRERAQHSHVAATFERELDQLLRHLLTHAIEPRVAAGDLDVAATALLATIEGTLHLGLSKPERHRTLRYALERIVDTNAPIDTHPTATTASTPERSRTTIGP